MKPLFEHFLKRWRARRFAISRKNQARSLQGRLEWLRRHGAAISPMAGRRS